MKVAIIGAGGKMGSWIASYFAKNGAIVSSYDIKPLHTDKKTRFVKSVRGCVKNADLVLICVPVQKTPSLIKECTRHMKKGAAIGEISSVKQKTFSALKAVQADIIPLCIHPMFGPGASENNQMKILLVPVRNKAKEVKIAKQVFKGASLEVLNGADIHDRSIAMVLGLTYFTNLVFARIISVSDLVLLKRVSGTTFDIQSLLVESIMTNEPELIAAIVTENPHTEKYIKFYLKEAERMATLSRSRTFGKTLRKIKSSLASRQDLQTSYRRLYHMLEHLH